VRTADAPNQQKIDCELALQSAVQNLSTSINESKAEVTHGQLPTIVASGSQITQVLQNLVGNSIKYRRLDIPLRVHIEAERRTGEWLFIVRDNGTGFEQKYSEQVFGIFKRLHGPGLPGTGMGLAICKNIVERHGGRIWAEAQPSQGATFYFLIPDLTSELLAEKVVHA
jgi:light-regulated signal transduction histidine kinase (bacteriophytochrome)